jgi:hypothetical protein
MAKPTDRKPFFLITLIQNVPKRARFVLSTLIMSALMLITTIYFNFYNDWYIIPILFVTAYFLTFFSVLEGVEKGEWITLFIMPVLFTIAAYVFYFLFPVRWLTRLPFVIIYGFSFYAILLTSNIFNVGVEKNIQLFRAAFSVNFLYQSVLMFLAIQILLSFRQGFLLNGLAAFLVTFPLSLQVLWSVRPTVHIPRMLFSYSLFMSIIIMQIVMLVSFIPIQAPIFSLFVTACYYSLSGLTYHYIDQRLFRQTVNEYVFVFIFVLIVCLLTIRW